MTRKASKASVSRSARAWAGDGRLPGWPPRGSATVIRAASLRTGLLAPSWNGASLSCLTARVSALKAFRLDGEAEGDDPLVAGHGPEEGRVGFVERRRRSRRPGLGPVDERGSRRSARSGRRSCSRIKPRPTARPCRSGRRGLSWCQRRPSSLPGGLGPRAGRRVLRGLGLVDHLPRGRFGVEPRAARRGGRRRGHRP